MLLLWEFGPFRFVLPKRATVEPQDCPKFQKQLNMASYKRKSEDFTIEREEVFRPTSHWKKNCDGGLHSHPGVLLQFFRDLGMWENRQHQKVEEILPAFTGYQRSVSEQAWYLPLHVVALKMSFRYARSVIRL